MRLLAFDTTGERLSVALLDGDRLRVRLAKPTAEQDEQLPGEADRLLRSAKLRLADMDAFVSATGPGRFTGIRVGLTFAGMLAKSLGKPAVGVSWLDACVWRSTPAPGLVIAIIAGWKGVFFFQVFHRDGETFRAVRPPRWAEPAGLARAVAGDCGLEEARLVGPGARAALPLLAGFLAEAEERGLNASDLLGPALARLEREGPGELAPLYIKPPHYEKQ